METAKITALQTADFKKEDSVVPDKAQGAHSRTCFRSNFVLPVGKEVGIRSAGCPTGCLYQVNVSLSQKPQHFHDCRLPMVPFLRTYAKLALWQHQQLMRRQHRGRQRAPGKKKEEPDTETVLPPAGGGKPPTDKGTTKSTAEKRTARVNPRPNPRCFPASGSLERSKKSSVGSRALPNFP